MTRAHSCLVVLTMLAAPELCRAESVDEAIALLCPHDERLAPLAREALAHHDPLDVSSLRATAESAGLPLPSVRAWVVRGSEESSAIAARAWITGQSSGIVAPRCASAREGEITALLMAPRFAEVTGIVQNVDPGATGQYNVTLPEGVTFPTLIVEHPDGSVERLRGAGAFRVEFSSAGAYALQLVASTSHGPLPFATWHVQSGPVPPPHDPDDDDDAVAEAPVLQDERDVLGSINRTRRALGVAALRNDPMLASIARQRAAELASQGTVAHALRPNDLPTRRLIDAHVSADRVAENVARASTLTEASERLERSPSHHANRVDPALDALGIGIAVMGPTVYLVEVYALHPRISDAAGN